MQLSHSQTVARQSKIWTGFLLYSIRRYWWLLGALIAFGAVFGYFTSLGTPNVYEVRASFVMPGEDALLEYERLLSRSLVTKAISAHSKFEVSKFVKNGWRQPIDMYNRSPFQMRVIAFPEHLKNMPHRIRLFADHSFEITIEANGTMLTEKGQAGTLLSIGSAIVMVDATEYWNNDVLDLEYTFVVQSQEALASRVLRNLSLIHGLDHPNRISLHYSDVHPDLAFDILDAFTQGYLQECKRRREELLRDRQLAVKGEMKALETKMLAADDSGFWTKVSQQGLLVEDSSVLQMLKLRQEIESLQSRLKIWEAHRQGSLTPEALLQQLHTASATTRDSLLIGLIRRYQAESPANRQALNDQIASEVDSLEGKDLQAMATMDAVIAGANAEILGSSNLARAWKSQMLEKGELSATLNGILLERYLAAMAEHAQIELETRQGFRAAQLIDPPYHIPGHGRGMKIRKWIAWTLGMGMLGILLSVVLAFSGRSLGSIFHFQFVSGRDNLFWWRLTDNALEQRKQATKLELSLKPEEKLIALIGENPHVDHLADAIAAGFAAFGRKVLILNSVLETSTGEWERIVIPQSTRPGWWLSAAAATILKEKAATYDRVLLCLPPLTQAPETAAVVRQSHVAFIMIQRNRTKVAEWREWEIQTQEFGIKVEPMFVTQA